MLRASAVFYKVNSLPYHRPTFINMQRIAHLALAFYHRYFTEVHNFCQTDRVRNFKTYKNSFEKNLSLFEHLHTMEASKVIYAKCGIIVGHHQTFKELLSIL